MTSLTFPIFKNKYAVKDILIPELQPQVIDNPQKEENAEQNGTLILQNVSFHSMSKMWNEPIIAKVSVNFPVHYDGRGSQVKILSSHGHQDKGEISRIPYIGLRVGRYVCDSARMHARTYWYAGICT